METYFKINCGATLMDIIQEQTEVVSEIARDLLKFMSYKKHELNGLTQEQIVKKYIKTFTRGVTA